jgi:hypothetical protein
MLEVVYDATDRKPVKMPVKGIIVSAVGGTLAAEDPDLMASTQAAAELVGILLNASGGCGGKAISDLKDSHLIGKDSPLARLAYNQYFCS